VVERPEESKRAIGAEGDNGGEVSLPVCPTLNTMLPPMISLFPIIACTRCEYQKTLPEFCRRCQDPTQYLGSPQTFASMILENSVMPCLLPSHDCISECLLSCRYKRSSI
jgi:hypothetical protein